MRRIPRSNRSGLRRAVAASVVIHAALAVALILSLRSVETTPGTPGVDTRIRNVDVAMFAEERAVTVAERIEPPTPPQPTPTPEPASGGLRPPLAQDSHPPLATVIPNALPADVIAKIRGPSAFTDPNVKPAALSTPAARPIHGAMKAGQTVVYVLDCSGSMGEFGKFDAARAALVATLQRQPGEVRFQVIAYNSTARPLVGGGCIAASAENITRAESALAGLKAAGRSNHAEAIRAAAALRPDVILILTDADDLRAANFKPALAAAGKPVVVCVARATADGVGEPKEVR
jgi:hypothetical protein